MNNFEKQRYFQNEPKYIGANSRNNLPKIKDAAYEINLHEYKSTGTQWIVFHVYSNNAAYFDTFKVHSKQIKRFIDNKNITTNQKETFDSIAHRCICTGFIDFITKSEIFRLYQCNLSYHFFHCGSPILTST